MACNGAQRPIRPLAAGLTAALLGALTLGGAGCTVKSTELAAGGFAPGAGERLSLAVGQARAQFPDLSAPGLKYTVRGSAQPGPPPELALQGEGVGFSPGLQLSERGRGTLKLYLDKRNYAHGHVVVRLEAGEEQTWPIVAYELRGRAERGFEFSYLLAVPTGGLRYLVVLGGPSGESGGESLAYEGLLFIPTPGKPLDEWSRTYKFDFGYHYPAQPAYFAQVDQAESLFRELQRDVPAVETLRDRLGKAEADAASAKQAPAGVAQRRGPDPAALDARAEEMKAQMAQRRAEAETKALRYYEVRRALDDAYAAFVLTNPYTWRNLEGQTEFYKRWQTVEFHHPRIDELIARLAALLPEPKQLENARSEAMAVFARNNNWDKNPAPKAASGAGK